MYSILILGFHYTVSFLGVKNIKKGENNKVIKSWHRLAQPSQTDLCPWTPSWRPLLYADYLPGGSHPLYATRQSYPEGRRMSFSFNGDFFWRQMLPHYQSSHQHKTLIWSGHRVTNKQFSISSVQRNSRHFSHECLLKTCKYTVISFM